MMPKVDVHLLHAPNEINIIGDLDDPHIVVHHLDGIMGNILAGRIYGFSQGTEKYVSFVDPDDKVNLSAFKVCIDELEANPELGGVYTNSTIVHYREDIKDRKKLSDHEWSMRRQYKNSPIHQLVVIRRDVVEQAVAQIDEEDTCITLAEQIIYAQCSTIAPWKFVDIDGYTWYCRMTGGHRMSTQKQKAKTIDYVRSILDTAIDKYDK